MNKNLPVLIVADRAEQFLRHDLREADHGVEGRAQLMADIGEKLRFGAVGGFGLQLSSLRLRESDTEHPECIGGYLRSDVAACPEIVGTVQPWGGGILESG